MGIINNTVNGVGKILSALGKGSQEDAPYARLSYEERRALYIARLRRNSGKITQTISERQGKW